MTVHCVTTMNKSYYNRIGKYMIYTWRKYCPQNFILHLYLEDFILPKDNKDSRIVVEDWSNVLNLYNIWNKTNHTDLPNEKGFTLKALSQIAAFDKIKSGYFLWLDADTVFINDIPENFFNDIIETYPLASWGQNTFESGTVWINLNHTDWNKIEALYKEVYLGSNGLPENERWYDGELLGYAVRHSGVQINNLKKLCVKKTSTPLNYSWIGKYIRHLKAKAKKGDRLEKEMSYIKLSSVFDHLKDHYV